MLFEIATDPNTVLGPCLEAINIPATLRRSHLDNLILKHEQAGEYHAERVAMYTKLSDKIE